MSSRRKDPNTRGVFTQMQELIECTNPKKRSFRFSPSRTETFRQDYLQNVKKHQEPRSSIRQKTMEEWKRRKEIYSNRRKLQSQVFPCDQSSIDSIDEMTFRQSKRAVSSTQDIGFSRLGSLIKHSSLDSFIEPQEPLICKKESVMSQNMDTVGDITIEEQEQPVRMQSASVQDLRCVTQPTPAASGDAKRVHWDGLRQNTAVDGLFNKIPLKAVKGYRGKKCVFARKTTAPQPNLTLNSTMQSDAAYRLNGTLQESADSFKDVLNASVKDLTEYGNSPDDRKVQHHQQSVLSRMKLEKLLKKNSTIIMADPTIVSATGLPSLAYMTDAFKPTIKYKIGQTQEAKVSQMLHMSSSEFNVYNSWIQRSTGMKKHSFEKSASVKQRPIWKKDLPSSDEDSDNEEGAYRKKKKEIFYKRMRGQLNPITEMYLTSKDIEQNQFEKADRKLLDPPEKCQKFYCSSSEDDKKVTVEDKLAQVVREKIKSVRKDKKIQDKLRVEKEAKEVRRLARLESKKNQFDPKDVAEEEIEVSDMVKLEKLIRTDTESIFKYQSHAPKNGLFHEKSSVNPHNIIEDLYSQEKKRVQEKIARVVQSSCVMKQSTQSKMINVLKDHEDHVASYKRNFLKQKKALEVSQIKQNMQRSLVFDCIDNDAQLGERVSNRETFKAIAKRVLVYSEKKERLDETRAIRVQEQNRIAKRKAKEDERIKWNNSPEGRLKRRREAHQLDKNQKFLEKAADFTSSEEELEPIQVDKSEYIPIDQKARNDIEKRQKNQSLNNIIDEVLMQDATKISAATLQRNNEVRDMLKKYEVKLGNTVK